MVLFVVSTLILGLSVPEAKTVQVAAHRREPDVVYVPTPPFVVDAMMRMGRVSPKDVVYDLGCGDGRIVIRAAKIYGARAVGIDIDPKRIEEAEANAREHGVADRVVFRLEDLFDADIGDATLVTLYLLPEVNLKLRPKLWKDLKVGARVVSHGYDMGDWTPDEIHVVVEHPLYLWTITEDVKRRLKW